MTGNDLLCTFEVDGIRNRLLEVKAHMDNDAMTTTLCGMEDRFGHFLLFNDRD
ncbi:MAG: hypothetical protein JW861_03175 [Bacteroidales bacterium]|nr:hypothetical protein [Bacteroidales bacterium]